MKDPDSVPPTFADYLGGLISVIIQNSRLTVPAAEGVPFPEHAKHNRMWCSGHARVTRWRCSPTPASEHRICDVCRSDRTNPWYCYSIIQHRWAWIRITSFVFLKLNKRNAYFNCFYLWMNANLILFTDSCRNSDNSSTIMTSPSIAQLKTFP